MRIDVGFALYLNQSERVARLCFEERAGSDGPASLAAWPMDFG